VSDPPPYPRIPHLVPGRGSRDDLLLSQGKLAALLEKPLVVEEKLDGACVAIWWNRGRVDCALRSGTGGLDRAGQLGRLRPWLLERSDTLRPLLEAGDTLHAEWMLLTHTVRYVRLPAALVGLDLSVPGQGFRLPEDRDRRLQDVDLMSPPVLFRGVLPGLEGLEQLLGTSQFGDEPMEGLVARTLDGSEPRLAKLVRPGFDRISDESWKQGRPLNVVVP
jgi:RNA ligase